MELSEDFFIDFEEQGYFIFDKLFSESELVAMRREIEGLKENHEFHKAGIGKASEYKIDHNQRGDFICWIDTLNPFESTRPVIAFMENLMVQLNRNFYLGIKSFECHYAIYPEGTFYKKHVDRHHRNSPRVVSFVLYLNENWKAEDGGQLRIYSGEGVSVEVQPAAGTLVIFLSEKEHEVMLTGRSRMSLTGWLRTTPL